MKTLTGELTLKDLEDKLSTEQIDLPRDIKTVIKENIWDLYD